MELYKKNYNEVRDKNEQLLEKENLEIQELESQLSREKRSLENCQIELENAKLAKN
jgi:hypothetical protein